MAVLLVQASLLLPGVLRLSEWRRVVQRLSLCADRHAWHIIALTPPPVLTMY